LPDFGTFKDVEIGNSRFRFRAPREQEGTLEHTFRMLDAENHLLYASDHPRWDFDQPSIIWDLPFVSQKAKHNILGGTAARLFKHAAQREAEGELVLSTEI
jgi:predicted TIM-barrel fold metal-dependent hydrolase